MVTRIRLVRAIRLFKPNESFSLIALPYTVAIYLYSWTLGDTLSFCFQSLVKMAKDFKFRLLGNYDDHNILVNADMIAKRTSKGLSCPTYSVKTVLSYFLR